MCVCVCVCVCVCAAECRTAFKLFDKDGSGSISAEELGSVLKAQGVELTADQLKALLKKYDSNGKPWSACPRQLPV